MGALGWVQALQRVVASLTKRRGEAVQIPASRVSNLDAVREQARQMQPDLAARDRDKLDEYFTSVRELEKRMAGRGFLCMAYFTPTVLPRVAVANIWLFFYTPGYGLLEQITGWFGLPSQNWLGDQRTALGAVTVVAVWKEAGFFMIFYLAALQSLNPSLREAAAIEGASRWYFFRRVQWPLLMPTTLFVMVNAVINAVRMVDHIVVLTRGGPDNASTLLLFHLYEVGFRYWDTGYAAALTMVLLAVLATVALVQFFVLDRKVHYQ